MTSEAENSSIVLLFSVFLSVACTPVALPIEYLEILETP